MKLENPMIIKRCHSWLTMLYLYFMEGYSLVLAFYFIFWVLNYFMLDCINFIGETWDHTILFLYTNFWNITQSSLL